jgi:O-antigen ligase/tetratricopeptide (TPR) repeat protein
LKNKIPFYSFLFLLIFAPLAFGTVELWSLAIMEASCFAAAFFYFCNFRNLKNFYSVPGLIPLSLILGYMFLQMIPLPAGLVGVLSPKTLALYEGTLGIVDMPALLTLSVNPRSTLGEFFRFSAYVSFYILAIQLLADSRRLKKTVLIVLGLCAIVALEAIMQKYLNNGRIYWLREAPPNSSFTGPYVYRNHFAGYVEMLAPVAIALVLRYRPPMHYGDSWRQRLANAMAHPYFNAYLLLGFATVLMAVSLFVSMSRGGMISFVFSCFLLLAVLAKRQKKSGSKYLGAFLFAAIFIAIGWVGWDVLDHRFGMLFDQQGNLHEARPLIWRDAIGVIKDFFVTGTGWGTFGNIYPSYRTYIENSFAYHAHNDFIEIFTNGGVVSLVLIGWFLVVVFRQVFKVLVRRRDSYAIYLTWGSLAGILAIMIHSVTDFNFQNGANGLYFFFLLALAVSASHTRAYGKKPTMLISQKKNNFGYIVMFCTGFLLLASLTENSCSLRVNDQLASILKSSWNTDTPEEELRNIEVRLERVLSLSPYNSYIYFLLADVNNTMGDDEAAAGYYQKAIRLNPTQATYLQNYGIFLAKKGEYNLADSLMQAGIRHDRVEPDRKRNYAKFLFSADENDKGLQVMNDVFVQDPGRAAYDIAFLVDAGFSDADIRRSLPDRVMPLLAFADYLDQNGDTGQAAILYRQALTNIDNEKVVQPDYFFWVSRFFSEQKRYEEALNVILDAIALFPANADLRVAAGNLYEEMGLTHRAIEEYRVAQTIDLGSSQARNRLAILQQNTD